LYSVAFFDNRSFSVGCNEGILWSSLLQLTKEAQKYYKFSKFIVYREQFDLILLLLSFLLSNLKHRIK